MLNDASLASLRSRFYMTSSAEISKNLVWGYFCKVTGKNQNWLPDYYRVLARTSNGCHSLGKCRELVPRISDIPGNQKISFRGTGSCSVLGVCKISSDSNKWLLRTSAYKEMFTHGHTDTQTHRHTDTHTHRHTDTRTHRHTDKGRDSNSSCKKIYFCSELTIFNIADQMIRTLPDLSQYGT